MKHKRPVCVHCLGCFKHPVILRTLDLMSSCNHTWAPKGSVTQSEGCERPVASELGRAVARDVGKVAFRSLGIFAVILHGFAVTRFALLVSSFRMICCLRFMSSCSGFLVCHYTFLWSLLCVLARTRSPINLSNPVPGIYPKHLNPCLSPCRHRSGSPD